MTLISATATSRGPDDWWDVVNNTREIKPKREFIFIMAVVSLKKDSIKIGEHYGDEGMGLFMSGYPNVNQAKKILVLGVSIVNTNFRIHIIEKYFGLLKPTS